MKITIGESYSDAELNMTFCFHPNDLATCHGSDGNIYNFWLGTGKSGVCSFQTNRRLEDAGVKSCTSDSVFPAQNICFKNKNFMGAVMVCLCVRYLLWKCILLTFKECVCVCV